MDQFEQVRVADGVHGNINGIVGFGGDLPKNNALADSPRSYDGPKHISLAFVCFCDILIYD